MLVSVNLSCGSFTVYIYRGEGWDQALDFDAEGFRRVQEGDRALNFEAEGFRGARPLFTRAGLSLSILQLKKDPTSDIKAVIW